MKLAEVADELRLMVNRTQQEQSAETSQLLTLIRQISCAEVRALN
jgi:hypothetical protein